MASLVGSFLPLHIISLVNSLQNILYLFKKLLETVQGFSLFLQLSCLFFSAGGYGKATDTPRTDTKIVQVFFPQSLAHKSCEKHFSTVSEKSGKKHFLTFFLISGSFSTVFKKRRGKHFTIVF